MGALGWARWDGCAGMVKKHVVTEDCANLGIHLGIHLGIQGV